MIFVEYFIEIISSKKAPSNITNKQDNVFAIK